MAAENQNVETSVKAATAAVEAGADMVKSVAKPIADATETATAKVAKAADAAVSAPLKASTKSGSRTRKVKASAEKVVAELKAIKSRRVKTERKPRGRKPATSAAPFETAKEKLMNYDPTNWMNSFANAPTLPGAEQLTNLFGEARAKGEEALGRSRAAAEDLADLTRGNVEALVSSAKIATSGAQTLGRSFIERGKVSVEEAGDAVKSLAEAKSPTEFFQLQSELARTSFDRLVAETSRFTEEMIKLAGETVQPISSRMAVAAERLNKITA